MTLAKFRPHREQVDLDLQPTTSTRVSLSVIVSRNLNCVLGPVWRGQICCTSWLHGFRNLGPKNCGKISVVLADGAVLTPVVIGNLSESLKNGPPQLNQYRGFRGNPLKALDEYKLLQIHKTMDLMITGIQFVMRRDRRAVLYRERRMGKLKVNRYGDVANKLFAFYQDKAHELEEVGQYYMAAIALAFALETGILTYLLVEFGEENGGELEIPDKVNMVSLIEACNEIDVLNAPIDIPSHVRQDNKPPVF